MPGTTSGYQIDFSPIAAKGMSRFAVPDSQSLDIKVLLAASSRRFLDALPSHGIVERVPTRPDVLSSSERSGFL